MTTTPQPAGDAPSLAYTCSLPLSTQTLTFLADLPRGHLKAIGSRRRTPSPDRIAVIPTSESTPLGHHTRAMTPANSG
ncbi:hypothetical protein Mro03_27330 [Microbispora rosea subsp. rosea]|nr:hypothetical protein Mro03_27330 [Microbispora rosea subsp. rosea]